MSRIPIALSVSAIFLTGILAGVLLARSSLAPGVLGHPPTAAKLDDALLLIRKAYIDPPDEQVLVESAIRGMTQLLDPYSIYIDSRHLPSIREDIDGNFGGVGLWFEMVSDTARVVSVVADGPSEKSGVLPGDRIIAVDDSTVVGIPSLVVQNRIKGPRGSSVKLTLFRPAIGRELPLAITRDIIPVNSVVGAFMLDDSTAYVRLARFSTDTAEEFKTAIAGMLPQGASRLLLDLRDNPGGLLGAAVHMADELLPEGAGIVSTEGRNGSKLDNFRSTSGGIAEDLPLIVLVNENSASASEIVAGAVQDNDRGLIVGRPTFGKGLVQSQFVFGDGSALHLTIARYHTPAGRPIENNLSRTALADAGDDSSLARSADSLTNYTTIHGRIIKGGEGIFPDELFSSVGSEKDRYFRFVLQSGLDIAFVRTWFDQREHSLRKRWADDRPSFVASFEVDSAQWDAFNKYVRAEASEAADRFSAADIEASRSRVITLLKARVGQLLFGPSVWQPIVSRIDPEIIFAMQYWKEAAALDNAR